MDRLVIARTALLCMVVQHQRSAVVNGCSRSER